MKISLTCPCGASIVFEDDKGRFINGGGVPTRAGLVYLIEQRAEEWQRAHAAHRRIEIVPAPGDACGGTKRLTDGSACPGCRACC